MWFLCNVQQQAIRFNLQIQPGNTSSTSTWPNESLNKTKVACKVPFTTICELFQLPYYVGEKIASYINLLLSIKHKILVHNDVISFFGSITYYTTTLTDYNITSWSITMMLSSRPKLVKFYHSVHRAIFKFTQTQISDCFLTCRALKVFHNIQNLPPNL